VQINHDNNNVAEIHCLIAGGFFSRKQPYYYRLIAERASYGRINNHDDNVAESNRRVAEGFFLRKQPYNHRLIAERARVLFAETAL